MPIENGSVGANMRLQEIKHLLAANRLRLTKSLGQNFLHDQNQLRRIMALAELSRGDSVLEIGPGLGALTEWLLAQGTRVLAIEKDSRLYELLASQYRDSPNLTLVNADALDYLREKRGDWSDTKLVANLPYSVGSPILVELSQADRCPERLVATLQIEVARRLMASPGDKDYGVLTLLLCLRYEPRDWFKIPASCFFPVPNVDSACVALVRRSAPLLSPAEATLFERIVKRGFSQRRKTMLKLLKQDWPAESLTEAYAQLQLAPEIRAERVTLDQFARLTRLIGQKHNELHG